MADYYTCEHDNTENSSVTLDVVNHCGTAHSTREAADECCDSHNAMCRHDGVNALRHVKLRPRNMITEPALWWMMCLLQPGLIPNDPGGESAKNWEEFMHDRRAVNHHPRDSYRGVQGFIEMLRSVYIEIGYTATIARHAERLCDEHLRLEVFTLVEAQCAYAHNKVQKARTSSKAYYRWRSRYFCLEFLKRHHRDIVELLQANPKLDHLEPIVDPTPQPQPQPQLDPMIDNNKTANEIAAAIAGILTQGQGQQRDVQAIAKQAARDAIAEATRDGTLTMSVEIIRPDKVVMQLPKGEALHAAFTPTMQAIAAGESPLLKGPAGTGKSMLARQIATALDLPFMHMSLSGGTGEHHFVGTRLPNKRGEFEHVGTPFLDAFENGGVMLLDEMDACDENVLLCINNGLANGELPVPGRDAKPYATKHKDFRLIAAANTWGSGPNAMYAGRNQLDAATLDRFMLTEVDYDRGLERSLVPDFPLLVSAWHTLRDQATQAQLRRVVSMRGLIRYAKMMRTHNWDVEKCLKHATQSWSSDERNACKVLEG
jgi:MoxR-like ATPase